MHMYTYIHTLYCMQHIYIYIYNEVKAAQDANEVLNMWVMFGQYARPFYDISPLGREICRQRSWCWITPVFTDVVQCSSSWLEGLCRHAMPPAPHKHCRAGTAMDRVSCSVVIAVAGFNLMWTGDRRTDQKHMSYHQKGPCKGYVFERNIGKTSKNEGVPL